MKKKPPPLVDAAPKHGVSGERCSVAVGSALRCCATTRPVWYRPEPTQCAWPAWKDGYCRKHHPVARAKRIKAEIRATEQSITVTEQKHAVLKQRHADLLAEQARWEAFLRPNT